MNIWFTSDSHFHHKNILTFEDRPFATVEEMNEGMIETWNNKVKKSDLVYHLGDFVFGGYSKWVDILPRLNGDKVLIQGNHDDDKVVKRILEEGYIKELHAVGMKMKYQKQNLWFTHYPMEIGIRPNKWSISGHIHSQPNKYDNQLNLGVDSPLLSYKPFGEPIHIDELLQIMNDRTESITNQFLEMRGNLI